MYFTFKLTIRYDYIFIGYIKKLTVGNSSIYGLNKYFLPHTFP